MLKLIQNEWMKLWHKKGTWAMVAMLILVILVPGAIMKYYEVKSTDEGSWQEIEQQAIQANKEMLASDDLMEEDKARYEEQIAISEYRLANDAPSQRIIVLRALCPLQVVCSHLLRYLRLLQRLVLCRANFQRVRLKCC